MRIIASSPVQLNRPLVLPVVHSEDDAELSLFFPIESGAVDQERAMKRQLWTEGENAKLKRLAGTMSPADVAAEMGRTEAAVVRQASKLKISLAYKKQMRVTFIYPHAPRF